MNAEPNKEARWSRLMKEAQDGNRAAYDRILREIVPYIAAVVSRQHRAQDRVEEVVQDVLLTVHRVRHTYDPARPFKPWLSMIARRRSIDLLRRRTRRAALEVSDDAAYETFPEPEANRTMEAYATTEGLSEAIGNLPNLQREAVELLKLKEMSLLEASALSGRSVAALKVNMHRAIKSLRVRLKGDPTGG